MFGHGFESRHLHTFCEQNAPIACKSTDLQAFLFLGFVKTPQIAPDVGAWFGEFENSPKLTHQKVCKKLIDRMFKIWTCPFQSGCKSNFITAKIRVWWTRLLVCFSTLKSRENIKRARYRFICVWQWMGSDLKSQPNAGAMTPGDGTLLPAEWPATKRRLKS